MILNTGSRTDIPAFYSDWFYNRVREGFVMARNPYRPDQILRYRLDPDVVDVLVFCTKNPAPMLPRTEELDAFRQFWHVTITAYGTDIEPGVPPVSEVCESFRRLASSPGRRTVGWRYDPIFLSDKYTYEYHLHAFGQIAKELDGYTETVVISFIDLYPKVIKNFPDAREVSHGVRLAMGKEIINIAKAHGMTVKPCAEGNELVEYGADCSGCMKISDYEKAIGRHLLAPKKKGARAECACYLSCDIGAYNTCRHLCRYCYANAETSKVLERSRLHNPKSPFLIGDYKEDDKIHDVPQKSWIDNQESFMI